MNLCRSCEPTRYLVEALRKQVLKTKCTRSRNRRPGLSRADPRKSVAKKTPSKNKCGPGQPPKPHRSWISRLAFPPLGAAGRWYWSDSARKERHFYQYGLQKRDSVNHFSATLAASRLPSPLKSRLWRRPQCPGNRHALARASEFPLAIHPRELPVCHRRHRNHPLASIEICHVFAEPTLSPNVASRNRKIFSACAEAVHDETSLWKSEENQE